MAAVRTHGRAVAISFVALLTLSVLPGFVPTASATADMNLEFVQTVIVPGAVVKPVAGNPAIAMKIGTVTAIFVNVTLTYDATDAGCNNLAATEISIDLDLRSIGRGTITGANPGPAGNPTTTPQNRLTKTYPYKLDTTVDEDATPGAPLNGRLGHISGQVRLPAHAQCNGDLNPTFSAPVNSLFVDNVRPSAVLDVKAFSPTGVQRVAPAKAILDDTMRVELSSLADVERATADLRAIGWSATETIGVAPDGTGKAVTTFTLTRDTTDASAFSLTVHDFFFGNNNVANASPATNTRVFLADKFPAVDVHRPVIPAGGLSLEALGTGQLRASITRPTDTDVQNTGYRLTLAPVGPLPASCAGKPTSLTYQPGASDPAQVPDVDTGTAGVIKLTVPASPASVNDANFPLCVSSPPTSYTVTATATDVNGNVGPGVSATKAPAVAPVTVTFAPLDAINKTWPVPITGSWTSSDPIPATNSAGEFSIRRPDNTYWTGTTWTAPSPGVIPKFPMLVTPTGSGYSGTFSINVRDASATGAKGDTIPDGTFTITAYVTNAAANPSFTGSSTATMLLDRTAPTFGVVADNKVVFPTDGTISQGGNVTIQFDIKDDPATGAPASSGPILDATHSINFSLVDASQGRKPGRTVTGGSTDVVCTTTTTLAAHGCELTIVATGATIRGTANLRFPDAELGNYGVQVNFTDQAGNPGSAYLPSTNNAPNVKLVPRWRVGAFQDDVPFVDAAGLLFHLYAAYNDTRSRDPNEACATQNTCRVTNVDVYVRNASKPENEAVLVYGSPFPLDSTPVALVAEDGRLWFNYSRANEERVQLPASINRSLPMLMRVRVNVTNESGTTTSAFSPWLTVSRVAGASLTTYRPVDNSSVFMFGNATSIKFTANFTQSGISYKPPIQWRFEQVRDANGPLPTALAINLTDAGGLGGTACRSDQPCWSASKAVDVRPADGNGPLFSYNFTNTALVPPGEYVARLTVLDDLGGELTSIERFFGVQAASPLVWFDQAHLGYPQREVFGGQFVGSKFNLSFAIDHGFSNLTANRVTITLLAPNATGFGKHRVISGNEGFLATMQLDADPSKTITHGNASIQLPSAPDGTPFDVEVTANTSSYDTGGRNAAIGSSSLLVKIDSTPPTAGVFLDQTNWTGNVSGDELQILGFGFDAGTGVHKVEVNIYDVNASATFDPTYDFGRGGWFPGDTNAWISSDLALVGDGLHARNVLLAPSVNGATNWFVRNDPANRPVIRPITIDNESSADRTLGFGRTYDITVTNMNGSAGARWNLSGPGNRWPAWSVTTPDLAHPGRMNLTFLGVRFDAAGSWSILNNTTSAPVGLTVVGPDFTVDASKSHEEPVHKVLVAVNNVASGVPTSGTTADVTIVGTGAAADETWYLYMPVGHGRGNEFAPEPVKSATPTAGGAIVFEDVDLKNAGVWRANKSTGTASKATFYVPPGNFESLGLDRNHTYRVQVRAADRLSGFPQTPLPQAHVSFDHLLPEVTASLSVPGALRWHDNRTMTVSVKDNHCVANVQLVAKTPHGNLTPINFTSPRGRLADGRNVADCSPVGGQWTLDLAQNPMATEEVGAYSYAAQVIDTAGNVFVDELHRVNTTVVDRQRALVQFLRLEPPVAQVDGVQTVIAEIFENDAVQDVRVILQLVDKNGVVVRPVGEGFASPVEGQVAANGTGNWSIRTTDLRNATGDPVDLSEGDYLWTVRARDVNLNLTCLEQGCHQLSILGQVSPDAPAFIALDAPAANATVNTTPSFAWRVLDSKATASSVTVERKTDGSSFARVNATLQPITAANRTLGYYVNHTVASPLPGGNVTMRVSVSGTFPKTDTWTFAVDAFPPAVTANVTGLKTVGGESYAVSTTRINVCAQDNESSVAQIAYTINDQDEDDAKAAACGTPFAPEGPDGAWTLRYLAKDAAGNVGRGNLTLKLDLRGPNISVAKHSDEMIVLVTDNVSGVDDSNVTIQYAYGGTSGFTKAKLEKVAGGNGYRILLPGNATSTGLKYFFEAHDRVGNLGKTQTFTIEAEGNGTNLPPTLAITAPLPGAKARDAIDLKWIATDPDDDPISITIALRDPAGTGDFLLRGGENTGSFTVDLSTKAAGGYTLVVTASDGTNSTQESVAFSVERGDLVECATCPPAKVEANRQVTLAVQVNSIDKTVASVAYNVTLDGRVVTSGQMKQTGGIWTASIVPSQAGNYKVFVTPQYIDGTSEPAKEVSSFTVESAGPPTSPNALPPSLLVLAVVGVLTVMLAAYGAFVRWK